MMKHLTALLVSLSIAAPAVSPAFAGPADTRAYREAQVIQAGDRRWRDGDHRRWDRRAHRREHRRDWRHDGRRDGRRDGGWRDGRRHHDRRYADRRYHDRRYYDGRRDGHRHRRHDNDAAYILGGLALGAIALYGIFEHGNRRERAHRR